MTESLCYTAKIGTKFVNQLYFIKREKEQTRWKSVFL